MKPFATLPLAYRIVFYVAAMLGMFLTVVLLRALILPGVGASIADKDFANYWMAGQLMFEGKVQDLFGPQPTYFAHLQAAFGPDFEWHNWSYPPHYLLLVWPLGLLGYKSALVGFLIVTGLIYLAAYRAYVGAPSALKWVSVGPYLVLNFWCVQNGFLSGAIVLGALMLREKRPILAGMVLALLTIKPQLGLLFPFLLIAERRWLVIASTAASTVVLVGASAAIFGLDAWRGYIGEVLPYQTEVAANLNGLFLDMLCSTFGALRNWGFDAGTALIVHNIVAVPVALVSIFAFFRTSSTGMRERANILLTATFLITPYALNYDLGGFAAAIAMMASADMAAGRQPQWRTAMFALAMLLPVLMILLSPIRGSIAPVVIFAMWLTALRQAGFTASLPGRRRQASPAAA